MPRRTAALGTRVPAGPGDVHAIVIDVPDEAEDAVLGVLAPGCLGARVEPGADGRRTIRVYRTARPDPESVAAALVGAGIEPGAAGLRIEVVPDGRWVERYQEALAPFPIGRRFEVDPGGAGSGALPPGRIALRLTPGRAFGTGEHPTTRLCVAALEDLVRPDTAWLDLGCGTAILALVAAHCGARVVQAVDVDPDAVAVAREVVRTNGLAGRIDVRRATPGDLPGAAWDGVVANLDERTLLVEAEAIVGLVAPGGVLACSGFLAPDAPAVADALRSAGLETCEVRTDSGWALAAGRRA
jgi:ribosomal protein L11 methyltransferase